MHCDEETLAALAMGEQVSEADASHAAACATCSTEVEQLRAIVSVLDGSDGELVEPPAALWDSIAEETGVDRPRPALSVVDGAGEAVPVARAPQADAEPAPRSGSRFARWSLAAAAGLALVASGAAIGAQVGGPQADGTVIAQTELADLSTEDEVGTARVEEFEDGHRELVIDAAVEVDANAALEVWLIDTSVEGMISVGFLDSAEGRFVIPDGFDLAIHPIVDISREPFDGVPTHSGDSLVRGVLAEA